MPNNYNSYWRSLHDANFTNRELQYRVLNDPYFLLQEHAFTCTNPCIAVFIQKEDSRFVV